MKAGRALSFLLLAITLSATGCNGERASAGKSSGAQKLQAETQPNGPMEAPRAQVPVGPTQDQFVQWAQTDEGLSEFLGFVRRPDVPLEARIDAIVALVKSGRADRIRRMVEAAPDEAALAGAVANRLVSMLHGKSASDASQERIGLLILLDMPLADADRRPVQEALARWAFEGLEADAPADLDGWFKERFPIQHLATLGPHAVEPVLAMVAGGAGVGSAALRQCTEYLVGLEDEKVAARAIEAFRKRHKALLERMAAQAGLTFPRDEMLVLEKLGGWPAVAHLLYLARHIRVEAGDQTEALAIARRLFEGLPAEVREHHQDELLATLIARLPQLEGCDGKARLEHARFVLEQIGIDGLQDLPLVETETLDGQKQQPCPACMSARWNTPERFFWGVAGDWLKPKVAKLRLKLPSEQAVAAAGPEEPDRLVDQEVTPLVANCLEGAPKARRILGVAGLRYLGTPGARERLQKLTADATDLSLYFGEGVTMGTLAQNALTAIELERRLVMLDRQPEVSRRFGEGIPASLRREVLSRMALPAKELHTTFQAQLDKGQAAYGEYKAKLAKTKARYRLVVRHLCDQQVRAYPSLDDKEALTAWVDATATTCRKLAEEKLRKEKLDFLGFDHESYRTAVTLAIMKRETIRKHTVKATIRAYLDVAVEVAMAAEKTRRRVARIDKWALSSPAARDIVDLIVGQTLDVLRSDMANPDKTLVLTEADIKEYRDYLELPEAYVLGAMVLHHFGIAKPQDDTHGPCRLHELAAREFAADTWFGAHPELADFLQETRYDAWHVLADTQEFGREETWRRWALSTEVSEGYRKLYAEADSFVDRTLSQWVADEELPADLVPVVKKNFPCTEIALDVLLRQFDQVRKNAENQGSES